jgi:hypothetical protein
MIKLVDLLEGVKEDYLNSLLEKILNKGIDSLTSEEKKYLDETSKGIDAKTPDEYLQDIFKEWKVGEIEVGNDIENIHHWSDLHNFDQELKDAFLSYVNLIKKYPNLNREDLALINSLGYLKDAAGNSVYESYSNYEWNSLDEKTYNKILYKEFGIEPYEDEEEDIETDKEGNITDKAYIKEFGYSWEEKQNFKKILTQVEKKYKFDYFDPKSLKNFNKIKEEAKNIYIKKYGSPKHKKYPF